MHTDTYSYAPSFPGSPLHVDENFSSPLSEGSLETRPYSNYKNYTITVIIISSSELQVCVHFVFSPGSINAPSVPSSCSTSNAITAVASCVVSLITGALVGALVHYCAVRKKSKCHKFYSLTITRKQQKQQPAPVYDDIVAQKGTVDSTHIELRENIAYVPVQN